MRYFFRFFLLAYTFRERDVEFSKSGFEGFFFTNMYVLNSPPPQMSDCSKENEKISRDMVKPQINLPVWDVVHSTDGRRKDIHETVLFTFITGLTLSSRVPVQ